MTSAHDPHNSMVTAIIQAHGRAFGQTAQAYGLTSEEREGLAPVHAAALEACLRMGFVAADAHCVAHAWQNQFQRTGVFDPNHWPRLPGDFGMANWPRSDAFPPCPPSLGLYAVLPDAHWIARMARAGVGTLQLRFKSANADDIRAEVEAAVKAVEGTSSLLFVNDHWQAAIEAGAYGVHLGQEDLDEANLQAIRDAGLRLGISTHGYAEMVRADRISPSYVAMGAVFPTTLKKMKTAPQGPGRLAAYAQLLHHYPLVAIGGIDATRMPEVLASGVGSVAVVRALVNAHEPEAAAAQLQAILQRHLKILEK